MPIYLCRYIYAGISMPIYLCRYIYADISMPIYLCRYIYADISMPIYLCRYIYADISMPIYLCRYIYADISILETIYCRCVHRFAPIEVITCPVCGLLLQFAIHLRQPYYNLLQPNVEISLFCFSAIAEL